MDLRQLQYVVAVADSLSFTRAAERCHVVQSALSHQIQRLETELDTRLFERNSRSVRTTPAGELLVGYARRILVTVGEAEGSWMRSLVWSAESWPSARLRPQDACLT